MANNCKVDFMTKEIRITKNFYKKAQIVGTMEFNTMIALQEKLPSFNIVFQNNSKPIISFVFQIIGSILGGILDLIFG